jgi:radical SAM protein with 4Fe4S-binding SPASM domain
MLKVKFRFRSGHRDANPAPPWQLKSLFINLTDKCNLRCQYCHAEYESAKDDLPFSLAERLLQEAADLGCPTIVLTGGEPFCYPQFEPMLQLCREKGLACKIATNGTMLNQENIDRLIRHGVRSLQISLDTLDPQLFAGVKGCSPAVHQNVLDGIRRCVEADKLHVVVSSVTQRSVRKELGKMLRYCHDAGVATFTVYHLIPYGRASAHAGEELSELEFVALLDELLAEFESLPRRVAVELGFPYAFSSPLLRLWQDRLDIHAVGCNAGRSHFNILADGEGVPCVCLGTALVSCGNAHRNSLAEMWNSPVLAYFRGEKAIADCADCERLGLCRGGCRTLSYLSSGRIDGPDPSCSAWM